MAKEKIDDFDAEGFIESMRESAVPTYHRVSDYRNDASVKPHEEPVPTGREPPASNHVCSDEEQQYLDSYVLQRDFRQVNKTGSPINIRDRYLERLSALLGALGLRNCMAAYLDKIIEAHLRQYGSVIEKIILKSKNQTKDK